MASDIRELRILAVDDHALLRKGIPGTDKRRTRHEVGSRGIQRTGSDCGVQKGPVKREAPEKLLEAGRRREIDVVLVRRLDAVGPVGICATYNGNCQQ